jgi:hypothetical protein
MMDHRPPERKRQFYDLIKTATHVLGYKSRMGGILEQRDDGSGHKYRLAEQMADAGMRCVVQEKKLISDMLGRIDRVLEARRNARNDGFALPDRAKIAAELEKFFYGRATVRSPPYGELCGAMPLSRDVIIPNGSFVCAHIDSQSEGEDSSYILAYVIGFDPDAGKYHVVDVDPDAESSVDLEVSPDMIVPMPTSIPSRRAKVTQFPVKTRVLALWAEETWDPDRPSYTTFLYPASVLVAPNWSSGNYQLKYEGDPPTIGFISERFVVKRMKSQTDPDESGSEVID